MTARRFASLPGASRVAQPPKLEDSAQRALNNYGAARATDGRIARSTGRDVQFATIVTPEFKAWIKAESKRRGKRMCVLLEDMRAAYEKLHSSNK
jgi:hypothetical protein